MGTIIYLSPAPGHLRIVCPNGANIEGKATMAAIGNHGGFFANGHGHLPITLDPRRGSRAGFQITLRP
ncbi:MAG TPA: hypothetical protein DEB24_05730 [Coriobacteriia bacterium]|nr:hypothetical protein [Coriobacteriia bacterium]